MNLPIRMVILFTTLAYVSSQYILDEEVIAGGERKLVEATTQALDNLNPPKKSGKRMLLINKERELTKKGGRRVLRKKSGRVLPKKSGRVLPKKIVRRVLSKKSRRVLPIKTGGRVLSKKRPRPTKEPCPPTYQPTYQPTEAATPVPCETTEKP